MTRSRAPVEEGIAPRLVLISNRPLIALLFHHLAERRALSIDVISQSAGTIERHEVQLSRATAAVVDLGVDAGAVLEFCRDLRDRHPLLPLVAVVCCTRAVSPSQLQALLRLGVTSVFDLDGSPEDVLRTLETAAAGGAVVHLTLEPAATGFLRELVTSPQPRSATKLALLELLSLGLPEREIGRRLHLSPHTVKHHIEDLRRELRVSNRIELAAWAGRHGFYHPEASHHTGARVDHASIHGS